LPIARFLTPLIELDVQISRILWHKKGMTVHTRFIVAASFSVLTTVAGASPAVKWGCAARSPANYWANSYNLKSDEFTFVL
jgi:hypothetical protein